MANKIAINGFGRIGRMVLRAIYADKECSSFQLMAINDLMDTKTLAHLFKYDSVHGINSNSIQYDESHLIVNGQSIKILAEKNPETTPN